MEKGIVGQPSSSPPLHELKVVPLGERNQGILEDLHRGPDQPRPYLTHARVFVSNPCIDARWDTQFDDLTQVNACRGTAKVKSGHREILTFSEGDLIHFE